MKARRILITGASGLLGRPVMKVLKSEKAWKVTGTAFSRADENLKRVDLADLEKLPAFLEALKPEIIIHSAAERRPDISMKDPEGTQRLNVDATAVIAEWAATHNAYLIYISTDYVFDGTRPPYNEDSLPNPLNDYGKSKRAGEVAVLSTCSSIAVLRVPILYGDVESLEESAVTGLAVRLLDADPDECVTFENWAVRHPTLTDDVAEVIRQMLVYADEQSTLKGIFHWSADEPMTKYEMACVMADFLDFDRDRLIPDGNPPSGAPRPRNSKLDTSLLRSKGIGKVTLFKEAIPRILYNTLKNKSKAAKGGESL